MGAEEELKEAKEQMSGLRIKAKEEYDQRVLRKAVDKIERDRKLEEIEFILREISQEIYSYNKLGRIDRSKTDIFKILNSLIKQGEENHGRSHTESSE